MVVDTEPFEGQNEVDDCVGVVNEPFWLHYSGRWFVGKIVDFEFLVRESGVAHAAAG
jgi:hypothetical protein